MEILNTKISKDIYSIIFKYINYSIENLEKIIEKNLCNDKYITIKDSVDLIDIFITVFRKGYTGFRFNDSNWQLRRDIIKKSVKEELQISYIHDSNEFCFYLIKIKNITYYYDLFLSSEFLKFKN